MEGPSKWLRKGAWTAEEDSLLRQCINKYGEGKWHQVPLRAGLNRCRKSCRLRWLNYLKPCIKRGKLSSDEVDLVLRLHKLLGNRWSLIAGRLCGRTANDVKNYWNTHLSKKHEPCCKTKVKNKEISCTPATPVKKIDVFKPRPRFFTVENGCSHLNGQPEDGTIPPCLGVSNSNNVNENRITCSKDKDVYELVDKTKMKNKKISCTLAPPEKKIDVFKPRPRSFTVENGCSHLNGQPEDNTIPSCLGLTNNNNVNENRITCNKDKDVYELVDNTMDGENMWWTNLLDECNDPDALVPQATVAEKEPTSAFNVEQLWSMLDDDAVELD